MDWIYLSPHLDDAALSAGGLIWEQTQAGQAVGIWTICAGDPPPGEFSPFASSLHARWGVGREAMEERRAEDIESCTRLGASYRHLDTPDCIYRRSPRTGAYLYASESALWVPVHPDERALIELLSDSLQSMLPPKAKLVSPLSIGDHVDHRLTRAVVEILARRAGLPLYFYADYPYVRDVRFTDVLATVPFKSIPISSEALLAWQDAIACHRSQISTFWVDLGEMRSAIQSYYEEIGGIWLGKIKRT